MSFLSKNLSRIKQSPTMEITARAQELKANGLNIISLSVGEPDFDTPQNIKEAGIAAINQGKTKYTAFRVASKALKRTCLPPVETIT